VHHPPARETLRGLIGLGPGPNYVPCRWHGHSLFGIDRDGNKFFAMKTGEVARLSSEEHMRLINITPCKKSLCLGLDARAETCALVLAEYSACVFG